MHWGGVAGLGGDTARDWLLGNVAAPRGRWVCRHRTSRPRVPCVACRGLVRGSCRRGSVSRRGCGVRCGCWGVGSRRGVSRCWGESGGRDSLRRGRHVGTPRRTRVGHCASITRCAWIGARGSRVSSSRSGSRIARRGACRRVGRGGIAAGRWVGSSCNHGGLGSGSWRRGLGRYCRLVVHGCGGVAGLGCRIACA